MRLFTLLVNSANATSDGIKRIMERLESEMEHPIIIEKGMDHDAMDRLRALSGKINGG